VLTELRIRNVGVIDDVTLRLGAGLNVLTGETGAGKTMVVSALQLLLGHRADADRVRAGAASALVEGCVAPPPDAAQEWMGSDEAELIVSREVAAAGTAGRSRARIAGQMAPVSALAQCLGAVVELHGQDDSSRLSSSAMQRELLDRFGGEELASAVAAYTGTFAAWRTAAAELEELRIAAQDREREADRLRFELGEIDVVDPQPGEEAQLSADLGRLEHAEALTSAAMTAAAALTDDGGARDVLAGASAALQGAAGFDATLDELAVRVESLTAEAQDAGLDLHRYATDLEADPAALETLRERHAGLVRLSRKYGQAAPGEVDTGGILAYAERARRMLTDLDSGEQRAADLAAEVARLADSLAADGRRLHDERTVAGKQLAEAVQGHLADLAMAGARMDVEVEVIEPVAHGADRVTFLLAANAGEPALPLGKAASGGERSRVALALRLALTDADATPVLVFDEVDAGIGGATALEVGRKLASLARRRQVLCVTHLPQLAAYADHHFLVTKAAEGDRTVAHVDPLDAGQRVAELSRMLSGQPDSAAALDHATELLRTAQREVKGEAP
jgi:DNA repair protein RecN (Recombination protein N)